MIEAVFSTPYAARVPAPEPVPWGWQAAPASTVERLLARAGYPEAERVHTPHTAASFRIRRAQGALFVDWCHSGSFSIVSSGEEIPRALVDVFVAFANNPLEKGR